MACVIALPGIGRRQLKGLLILLLSDWLVSCPLLLLAPGTLQRRLGPTSKELVAALLPLTTHKRHRVRIAAIEAIRDVVQQVSTCAIVSQGNLEVKHGGHVMSSL